MIVFLLPQNPYSAAHVRYRQAAEAGARLRSASPIGSSGPRRRRRQRASVGKISAKCCSFSAVSAPNFARKYAFCSIFQNLPDSQAEFFEI